MKTHKKKDKNKNKKATKQFNSLLSTETCVQMEISKSSIIITICYVSVHSFSCEVTQ